MINYNKKREKQEFQMSKQLQQNQQFNDTLSLIRILKKAVSTFDAILSQQQFNSDASSMIYKISQENKFLLEIIKRQKIKNHQVLILSNDKIKMRLRQWITENRNRYVNGYHYKQLRSFLQQVQIAFGIFQKNHEFLIFVTKIYTIISDQLRIFKIKYDLFHHKNPLNIDNQYPKVRKTKSLILNSNFALCSQSFNLSSIYGLQIDYSHLKTSVALCRRNKLQFLQSQLQRNKEISKQIENFTIQFYLQRYRFRMKRKHFSQLYSKKVKSSFKNLRVKTMVHEKLYHNFEKQVKKCSSKQNRQEIGSNKLVFKVNNVYVSGNQFDKYSDQAYNPINPKKGKRKGPNFLTRAIRQPLASRINHSNTRQLRQLIS